MNLVEALAPDVPPILRDYINAVAEAALARGAQQLAIDRADIEALRRELRDKLAAVEARFSQNGLL